MEEGGSGAAVGPVVRFTSLNSEVLIVGVPFLAEGELRLGDLPYSRAALSGSRRFQAGDLLLAGVLDLRAVSSGAPLDVRPALGDEHAVPGLRWGEGRGRGRAVVGLDAAYPVFAGFAMARMRTGAAPEELDRLDDVRWVAGGQLGMHWRSPVGVVEAGWSIQTGGTSRFGVSLGRRF